MRGVSDLAVGATVHPGSAYVGQPLTYTIAVTNNGPVDEPDAVLEQQPGRRTGRRLDDLDAGRGPAGQPGHPHGRPGAVARGTDGRRDPGRHARPAERGDADDRVLGPGAGLRPGPLEQRGFGRRADRRRRPTWAWPSRRATVAAVAQVDWTYTVQVTNAGPSPATGVVATIPLPAGVQFVSASSEPGTAPVGAGRRPHRRPGDDRVRRVGHRHDRHRSVRRRPRAARSRSPRRSPATQYDPDPADNQASLNLAVAPSVNIALSLSSTPQVVQSGQMITFTASVSNFGTTPATGVLVDVPAGERPGLRDLVAEPGVDRPGRRPALRPTGQPRPRRLRDGLGDGVRGDPRQLSRRRRPSRRPNTTSTSRRPRPARRRRSWNRPGWSSSARAATR